MRIYETEDHALQFEKEHELVRIEPWGNGLRVRATRYDAFTNHDWALLPCAAEASRITIDAIGGEIQCGKITARILSTGKLSFYNAAGKVLLEEYWRTLGDSEIWKLQFCSSLRIPGREYAPLTGGDYALTARFESDPAEHVYGMGQYQQQNLNLKGCELELAQRNSQASVPFMLSSLGYGLLWNNPAIGRVTFGNNITTWTAASAREFDYWITTGDTPASILEAYANVTGKVPEMPEYGIGMWQCKLRYRDEEEVLSIAQEYKRRGLPLSMIVIDYFHWPLQGDWRFDRDYFPDPAGLVRKLEKMGIKLMVSVWPYVDYRSENFPAMQENGLLIQIEKGIPIASNLRGNTIPFDATNPAARAFVWDICKKNYYTQGIHAFWLDEAEPEYIRYDFENYRYHLGTALQVGNYYPFAYAKAFYDGMRQEGQTDIVNLLRCAWAGSQRFGALVWSGDVPASFRGMKNQIAAGLNIGLAGIPWWTTDIGGFFGGAPADPAFRELLIRWFQWATFCPVMRMHGKREPLIWPDTQQTSGGGFCPTGQPNELWSYGEDVYKILEKYLWIRETMKPYIRTLMRQAHASGTPVMRPLFYDFPKDAISWTVEDAYMFGPNILVAPVSDAGQQSKDVYLPAGVTWVNIWSGEEFAGGQTMTVPTPIVQMPVFTCNGYNLRP